MLPAAHLRRSRRLWRIVAPLAVLAATTTGCFGGAAAPPSSDVASATALFEQVNVVRRDNGLPPLAWCPHLVNASVKHTIDMATHGFMSHVGSDGSTFVSRAATFGYGGYSWLAENIASGQTSVEQVLGDWMASPGHRANILNAGVNHAGYARVDNSWTQDLGAGGSC
jgi:uncharacterized protein YkwD